MEGNYKYDKREVLLNGQGSILVEDKMNNGYMWKDVTFKADGKETYIGSYYTFNYIYSREGMDFNNDYIAILNYFNEGDEEETRVDKLFDIKNRSFVEGTQEDLLNIYNESFKGYSRTRKN